MKFYKCPICGNVITILYGNNPNGLKCCNNAMQELVANSVDAANEKHVPVIEKNNNIVTVKVGTVEHPMTEQHYITMIVLETNKQVHIKHLQPNQKPEATFALLDDEVVEKAYEYCNLHGLWVK